MRAALQIQVVDGDRVVYSREFADPVELGRQNEPAEAPYRDTRLRDGRWRAVIAPREEFTLSRRQALLEQLANGCVRLTNLSAGVSIRLGDGTDLPGGASRELSLPAEIVMGGKTVRLLRAAPAPVPPASYRCARCGQFWEASLAENNDFLCTRRCGGALVAAGADTPDLSGRRTLGEQTGECRHGSLWRLAPDGPDGPEQLCILPPHCVPFVGLFAAVLQDLHERRLPRDRVHVPLAVVAVQLQGETFGAGRAVCLAPPTAVADDPLATVALLEPAYAALEWADVGGDVVANLRQLAESLAAIHEAGLMHTEINPETAVQAGGRLVLAGTGVARMVAERINTRATDEEPGFADTAQRVPVAPVWTAPEVIRGDRPSPAADVYSLCALGYTFACGQLPMGKRAPWRTLELLEQDWAAYDEHLQAVADPRLREVLTAGLSPDPARRPRDGAALLKALEGG
jgi:hypothetical protein